MAVIGKKAPEFALPSSEGEIVSLKSLKGSNVVLYFYPKDMTPGCTTEACDFRDSSSRLKKLGAKVFGVSKDSVARHQKFIEKEGLNFPLLSDEDGKVCNAYGVWVEKSLYGRKYMGIERSTFIIGKDGKIKNIFTKVKVKGHVDEVIDALKSLE